MGMGKRRGVAKSMTKKETVKCTVWIVRPNAVCVKINNID